MSIPRIISLVLLYLTATLFAPMPLCCCSILGDPYPATPFEEITDEQWAVADAQDTSGMFFGFIGIAGVILYFPATILLHIGQCSNTTRMRVFRWIGFGLMLFWMKVVISISAIAYRSILSNVEFSEAMGSDMMVIAVQILALNIAITLPCIGILVRKPKALENIVRCEHDTIS